MNDNNFYEIKKFFESKLAFGNTAIIGMTVSEYGMQIFRKGTGVREDDEGNEYNAFEPFEVEFSIEEAKMMRDFLIFALQ